MGRTRPPVKTSATFKLARDSRRTEFYTKYKKESDDHDGDFLKKYDDDLNTTLIFAGLFSAVTSAFIIDVQADLQPDYNQVTAALVRILIQTIDNSTSLPAVDLSALEWTGPSSTVVAVQSLLYASLAASLISAFIAMLGKQWLNRYAQIENRGSLVDRCRARQEKHNGVERWHFHTVMETLPFMLQAALLLMGCALSRYLWDIQPAVAAVIICTTSFGVLCYVFIVASSIYSYHCPFQTPLSIIIRSWILRIADGKWFQSGIRRFRHSFLTTSVSSGCLGKNATVPRPLYSDREVDLAGSSLDAECVTWILEESTDSDLVMSAVRMIPEIQWHDDIGVIPSVSKLETILSGCMDYVSGAVPRLNEGKTFGDTAFAVSKALTHLFVQVPSTRHVELGLQNFHAKGEELHSVVTMMSASSSWRGDHFPFNYHPEGIPYDDDGEPSNEIAWMCHTLVCALWNCNGKYASPNPIEHLSPLLSSAMCTVPYSPPPVITDCLLMISLMLGIPLNHRDVYMVDKSQRCTEIGHKAFIQIGSTFETPCTEETLESSVSAINILSSWASEPQSEIFWQKQRWFSQLFDQIMRSTTVDDEVRLESGRLALKAAYMEASYYVPGSDFHSYGVQSRDTIVMLLDHKPFLEEGGLGEEMVADALEGLWVVDVDSEWVWNLLQESMLFRLRDSLRPERHDRLRRAAMLVLGRAAFWSQRFGDSSLCMSREDMVEVFTNLRTLWDDISHDEEDKRNVARLFSYLLPSAEWAVCFDPGLWKPLEVFLQKEEDVAHNVWARLLVHHDGDDAERVKRAWSLMQELQGDPNVVHVVVQRTWEIYQHLDEEQKLQWRMLIDRHMAELTWSMDLLKQFRERIWN